MEEAEATGRGRGGGGGLSEGATKSVRGRRGAKKNEVPGENLEGRLSKTEAREAVGDENEREVDEREREGR